MSKYYVLIKRKGSKKILGAVPARKGVTKAKLKKVARKNLKKGLSYKIVSRKQLMRILLKQRPKIKSKRRRIIRKRRRKR